ncbi:MAG: archaemetzincin family Zn-dependent metalloprotease [Candidatus Hadarchaeum sp.]|uniref:archaemetzincin family Zn-dependent metalloprotease n=1 Tax=Candidatus Hadarchaeum sp. TaxID=2883567 RepID=UPI003D0D5CEE
MKIEIIAVGNMPPLILQRLPAALIKTFKPLVEKCVLFSIESLPPNAYDAQRQQYRAETVLHYLLLRANKDSVILGIVNVDIYVPELNFVFGLSQLLGRGALVSIYRLNPAFYGQAPDPELFWIRAKKEAVHELGHVFGLDHCNNPRCVMSFSNSILEVDRKSSEFCNRCRVRLFRCL